MKLVGDSKFIAEAYQKICEDDFMSGIEEYEKILTPIYGIQAGEGEYYVFEQPLGEVLDDLYGNPADQFRGGEYTWDPTILPKTTLAAKYPVAGPLPPKEELFKLLTQKIGNNISPLLTAVVKEDWLFMYCADKKRLTAMIKPFLKYNNMEDYVEQ